MVVGAVSLAALLALAPAESAPAINPDPVHVRGVAGAQRLEVLPRGDIDDARNLQWAVDHIAAGGTVELGRGTFFLGDDVAAPKATVVIGRGLRLVGRRSGDEWSTVVRGGGVLGCGPTGIESGAFRIVNDEDDHPVVLEDLWLREWTAEAVCIEASRGFILRRCRLSHPVNTTVAGSVRFVHALWTTGSRARGDFVAEENRVELGGYAGEKADDEQFLGVFFSNHDTIRVVDNVIRGIDEGIEIIGNRVDRSSQPGEGPPASGPGRIVVARNRVAVDQQPGERWPSTFGILVAGNRGAESVDISDNELVVRGRGFAFGLSGERLRVTDNRVELGELDGEVPAGAMTLGGFGTLAGLPMGSSLDDSVLAGNTFTGKVRQVGIVFRPGRGEASNESHGNRFDLGDSLAALGAPVTLSVSAGAHANEFRGDLGVVVDEAGEGANRYDGPRAAAQP